MLFALLHKPIQAFSVTLPGSYSVTMAWGTSPSPGVTGYRLYYGGVSGNYANSVVLGNVTTSVVSGLASGVTYYFAVTAYNASGQESPLSKEISYVPGVPGVQLLITPARQFVLTVSGLIGHTYEIQATPTFAAWTVIGTVTLGTNGSVTFTDTNAANYPNRFYRTHDTQP